MSEFIDVPVSDSWVDVNTVTGITVGNPMQVMNKGSFDVYIAESTLEPTEDNAGRPLTTIGFVYATASVLSGSLKIWMRCPSAIGTVVAVQEA